MTKIERLYDANLEKMFATRGTPAHEKYVAIERELNKQSIARLRKLGVKDAGQVCDRVYKGEPKEDRYKLGRNEYMRRYMMARRTQWRKFLIL
jgi:hypothetical protein